MLGFQNTIHDLNLLTMWLCPHHSNPLKFHQTNNMTCLKWLCLGMNISKNLSGYCNNIPMPKFQKKFFLKSTNHNCMPKSKILGVGKELLANLHLLLLLKEHQFKVNFLRMPSHNPELKEVLNDGILGRTKFNRWWMVVVAWLLHDSFEENFTIHSRWCPDFSLIPRLYLIEMIKLVPAVYVLFVEPWSSTLLIYSAIALELNFF